MRKRIEGLGKVHRGDIGCTENVKQGLHKYQLQLRMFCYIRDQQH